MAIAVDATSYGYNGNPALTTLTVSHTCAANDSVLVAMVIAQSDIGTIISSVTWNGTALTRRVEGSVVNSVTIWTLDAPASGTHDIVVTSSAGVRMGVGSISFTAGSYDLGGYGTNAADGTSASQTTSTTGDTGFICSNLAWNDPTSLSYTGSGTAIETAIHTGNIGRSYVYEAFSASNNPTETWTQTTAGRSWDTAYLEIYDLGSSFKPIVATF